ncbi:MAG TPA: DUF433 domain-containing protein [Gemmataceae bacterium]|jgi:uncharacterized protein (DUF433 family)|nr:DUF433 domain-containing protein [Gemmataceae bacterium]
MADAQKPEVLATGDGGDALVQKTPGVCGGRACIRRTRIPVWSLVEARGLGIPDEELLGRFVVPLTKADVDAAWAYYADHRQEIEQDIWENQACMMEHDRAPVPVWSLVVARRLGMPDERIRAAFFPSLSQAELDAAWRYYQEHPEEIEQAIRQHQRA